MLHEGRIPMTAEEEIAVSGVLGDLSGNITRRDPGETGPLIVSVDGGGEYLVTGSEVEALHG